MQLLLHRNGEPVEHPPIYAGQSFYYTAGQIGTSAAVDGWTHEQVVYEDMGEPQFDEDGQIIEQEPVIKEIINWSLVPAPFPPELEETDMDRRAKMPTLAPTEFAALLAGLRTTTWPNGVLPSDIVTLIETHIPAGRDRELALWAWNRSQYFERINPLIDQIGALLGLTPEEIDIVWMAFVGGAA